MTRLFSPFGGAAQSSGGGGEPIAGESGPEFTWVLGKLTRIDYDSGNYKVLSYNVDGLLSVSDYHVGSVITRQTFFYNVDNSINRIEQVVI